MTASATTFSSMTFIGGGNMASALISGMLKRGTPAASIQVVEPLASTRQQLIDQLRSRGMGLLITDHNVRETLAITDRAYILSEGSILASGSSQEVGSDPLVRRHYLGESFRL